MIIIGFLVPLKKEWIPPIIALFLLSSFFNPCKIEEVKTRLKKLWPFFLFFLILLIGLTYTSNLETGLKNLETKLALIVFPIAFSFANIDFHTIKFKVLKAFLEGCFIAIIFGVINVFYTYIETGSFSIVYGKLSYFSHNSYLAMYLNLSLIILYYLVMFPNNKYQISNILFIILTSIITLVVAVLASKAGLICLVMVHSIIIGYWIIKHKQYIKGTLALLLIPLFFFVLYNSSDKFKYRIDEVTQITSQNKNEKTSTNLRITTWKNSLYLISQHPLFGVGIGDAQDKLDGIHLKKGKLELYKLNFNAHNQYLQTTIAIGYVGLLSLLTMLIFPIIKAWKLKDYIYIFFIGLITINMLFESMLEKQEGVLFISFFISLFYMQNRYSKTQN